ncbi:MAG TPA: hypothetical protein VII94_06120 [Candidatus Saccharimonadales bacterium]
MSKVKDVKPVSTQEADETSVPEVFVPVPVPVPAPATKLVDVDKLNLDLAKSKNQAAIAEAKAAIAEAKIAELSYRYTVLQIYMAYGLTAADAISDAGEIIRGGALQQQSGQ